jgi:mannose-6-phosphate isomerase-like protein (cupin superfamily)
LFVPQHSTSPPPTSRTTIDGIAEVRVGDQQGELSVGGVAVVAEGVPHQVRNAGAVTLRFVAVYVSPDVVTRYDDEVQPDGVRERRTVS